MLHFFRIGTIIATSNMSGTVEVMIMAEYRSHSTLIRGSDMAWKRWFEVIPSQPDEGLFLSDFIAQSILLSVRIMLGLEISVALPV